METTLHIIARRLPDQLLTQTVDAADAPPAADTDETIMRLMSDGTLVRLAIHWQPPMPAPNAIERATLAEVLARMDVAALVPATPPAQPGEADAAPPAEATTPSPQPAPTPSEDAQDAENAG